MKTVTLVTALLLLCGFAGAQTNTFCASNQPCTVSGAWNFTGPTSLPSVTLLRGRIDATQFAGVDMCAKVNAAWTYAVGLGYLYAEVDATGFHGRQDVAGDCFASFPATALAPQGFVGYLKVAPDVKIVTSVTQNPPSNIIIDGGTAWGWFASGASQFSQAGALFMPSDTFNWTTQKAVLTLGYAGGSTNPRGVWLTNIGVDCISPNGTYHSGSIGIYNGVSQESTGGDGVFVNGCTVGIRQEADGSIFGSQNSGPWKRLTITSVGVPNTETGWIGFDYCSLTGNCAKNHGIDGASIAGPTGGAPGSVGIAVNASTIAIRNVSCEEETYCIEISRYHAAFGVTLDDISGAGHPDYNMTAVIHNVSGSIAAFTAMNISSESQTRSDYVIQDEGSGGLSLCGQASTTAGSPCFGATKTTPALMFYSCSFQAGYAVPRTCIWNTPAQQGFGTQGSVTNFGANITLDSSHFAQAVVLTPPSAAGITATLPNPIPHKNWYTTIINGSVLYPLFINPNGINLMGTTNTWTLPPQASVTIHTSGASYYAASGWAGGNSFINLPSDLLGQTVSLGDTNITCRYLGNTCPAGLYRLSIYVNVTTAGTAGTLSPYCKWRDTTSTIEQITPANLNGGGTTVPLTTIGNFYAAECVFYADGTSNPKIGVTLTGATGTPAYAVHYAMQRVSVN